MQNISSARNFFYCLSCVLYFSFFVATIVFLSRFFLEMPPPPHQPSNSSNGLALISANKEYLPRFHNEMSVYHYNSELCCVLCEVNLCFQLISMTKLV